MAGGDGSQAAVACVAAEHDIPYVTVPAGTRNHFALDFGINPRDVVRAVDAFAHAPERRIDLGSVNGRGFVNNVSLGVYGQIVQSPQYRDARLRTVIETLPEMIGPDVDPFDLRFTAGWPAEWSTAAFEVDSDATVTAGIGGEAVVIDAPLRFASLPSALRVRVPAR